MGRLTGNKGEWSEIYVFLKILSDARIYGADKDLKRNDSLFYDVRKIIRDEGCGKVDYVIDKEKGCVRIVTDGTTVAEILFEKFGEESAYLLKSIISGKNAFGVERAEIFIEELGCHKLKAPSPDKTDISMQIHDSVTCMEPVLGFSIKSNLGNAPTLINAGRTTNFIYALEGEMSDGIMNEINGMYNFLKGSRRTVDIKGRMQALKSKNISLKFEHTESDTFDGNLRMVDSQLPRIIAEMLKIFYLEGISDISKQVEILNERDPLEYGKNTGQPFYSYKVKKFLTSSAIGMNPGSVWDGMGQANGGYIVVREDGEVLCYHLYNRNDFEDYLLNNTKMDKASVSRYGFGSIEKDLYGKYTMKLNLQVRFK